jgi:hypothetical protein
MRLIAKKSAQITGIFVRKMGEALENPGVLMHRPSVAHNPRKHIVTVIDLKTAKNTLQWQARRAEKIAVPPLRHFYWTEVKKFVPSENCDNDTGMFFLLQ